MLRELLEGDVERGFALPIPKSAILSMPGAEVAPMGIAAQSTINERGEIIANHDPRTPNNRNSLASNNFGSARQPTTPVRAPFALFH